MNRTVMSERSAKTRSASSGAGRVRVRAPILAAPSVRARGEWWASIRAGRVGGSGRVVARVEIDHRKFRFPRSASIPGTCVSTERKNLPMPNRRMRVTFLSDTAKWRCR